MVKKKPQETDHKNDADIQDEPTDAHVHDGGDRQESVPVEEPVPPPHKLSPRNRQTQAKGKKSLAGSTSPSSALALQPGDWRRSKNSSTTCPPTVGWRSPWCST